MSDAAQAFEQLRAEVTVMRRTVEELRTAIEVVPTVDYAPTLGEIAAAQAQIAEDIGTIAEATEGPSYSERLSHQVMRARDTILHPVVAELRMAQDRTQAVADSVRRGYGIVREQQEQLRALLWAFGAGVVAGLLLSALVVARITDRDISYWFYDPMPAEEPVKAR